MQQFRTADSFERTTKTTKANVMPTRTAFHFKSQGTLTWPRERERERGWKKCQIRTTASDGRRWWHHTFISGIIYGLTVKYGMNNKEQTICKSLWFWTLKMWKSLTAYVVILAVWMNERKTYTKHDDSRIYHLTVLYWIKASNVSIASSSIENKRW